MLNSRASMLKTHVRQSIKQIGVLSSGNKGPNTTPKAIHQNCNFSLQNFEQLDNETSSKRNYNMDFFEVSNTQSLCRG
jgi:hypothetical protein